MITKKILNLHYGIGHPTAGSVRRDENALSLPWYESALRDWGPYDAFVLSDIEKLKIMVIIVLHCHLPSPDRFSGKPDDSEHFANGRSDDAQSLYEIFVLAKLNFPVARHLLCQVDNFPSGGAHISSENLT